MDSNKLKNSIKSTLNQLRERDQFRELFSSVRPSKSTIQRASKGELINLSSNDYLGLALDERVIAAAKEATEKFGAGSSSSRLVTGTLDLHEELERGLANWLEVERVLVFGSGYHVNLGVLSALASRNSLIVADKLSHASLIDGSVLSGAKFRRFNHNDADHLERILAEHKTEAVDKTIIVTESVFSMDGDIAPISKLYDIAKRFDCYLLVDEAHAFGVFGRGISLNCNLRERERLLVTGTLSKAFGSFGGVVACSDLFADYFINNSRSFIYSTSLPPASLGAALMALELIKNGSVTGEKVLSLSEEFRTELSLLGFSTGESKSQIVPLILSENKEALKVSQVLEEAGVLAYPMRPPTVPQGQARIRFSITAANDRTDLEKVTESLSNL